MMKNLFIDKLSGNDFNHPQHQKLTQKLKFDDLLCILTINRLNNNYEVVQNQSCMPAKEMGIDISVLDKQLLVARNRKTYLNGFGNVDFQRG